MIIPAKLVNEIAYNEMDIVSETIIVRAILGKFSIIFSNLTPRQVHGLKTAGYGVETKDKSTLVTWDTVYENYSRSD